MSPSPTLKPGLRQLSPSDEKAEIIIRVTGVRVLLRHRSKRLGWSVDVMWNKRVRSASTRDLGKLVGEVAEGGTAQDRDQAKCGNGDASVCTKRVQ